MFFTYELFFIRLFSSTRLSSFSNCLILSPNVSFLLRKLERWHGKHVHQAEEICLCPCLSDSFGTVDQKKAVFVSLGFGECYLSIN